MTDTNPPTIDMKTLLLSALAMAATVIAPGISLAATYAYVNTTGDVMTMDASSASQALLTAPGISLHSGVMLINTSTDPVVGDKVGGV
ncbi:MAG: hypothetical protein JWL88_103 [Parcubacteria group bacterium]|nr:hypothetical protein [Parcubacteria group bacterium]